MNSTNFRGVEAEYQRLLTNTFSTPPHPPQIGEGVRIAYSHQVRKCGDRSVARVRFRVESASLVVTRFVYAVISPAPDRLRLRSNDVPSFCLNRIYGWSFARGLWKTERLLDLLHSVVLKSKELPPQSGVAILGEGWGGVPLSPLPVP